MKLLALTLCFACSAVTIAAGALCAGHEGLAGVGLVLMAIGVAGMASLSWVEDAIHLRLRGAIRMASRRL